MAYVIAFAGKGGTGKTTIAALTVRYLIERKKKAVLAVDADSNSCLNEALGVEIHATIGKLREESLATVRSGGERPGGMSMEQLFDYQVQQSVIEANGFDLMVMGRPEGPGCYCAANNIIRKYTDILAEKYPYVVLDNEAGMEHLSRRTTHKVDLLLVISDPTKKGVQTANRISSLVDELQLEVDRRKLIINRVSDENFEKIKSSGVELPFTDIFNIPEDDNIFHLDLEGRPVFDLPAGSAAVEKAFKILDFCSIP
ncbi:MAG TPA: carbon monoxide dehydrogenase [Nitrospiraceae bacterium]|nr:carbon monoxide dehydrogenase [Nitrospiraceae bacterium]